MRKLSKERLINEGESVECLQDEERIEGVRRGRGGEERRIGAWGR